MKKYIILTFVLLLSQLSKMSAQIERVIVESYYISDTLDATDTTAGRMLDAGSKTYRIYIDLMPNTRIRKIYGDTHHALKIKSTAPFYNNVDRPTAYFGYLINKNWFPDNPLLVLDSWLTIGRATKTSAGVLKIDDTDSSFIGGTKNYGGTAAIPSGLLINNDSTAGFPLTVSDGMMNDTATLGQWLDNGFKDLSGIDTTVFGSINTGTEFISNNVFVQQNSGVVGIDPDTNRVLIAQLTTKGELSFELNIEVEEYDGNTYNIVKYVAKGDTLLADENLSPSLTYPPVCGCLDPKYLEYNVGYACVNNDSCKTLIVYGCMDTMACNYHAEANFNIPSLCCYPGYCNDRDLSIVCPLLAVERSNNMDFKLFPVPAFDKITLQIPSGEIESKHFVIYNALGENVFERNLGVVSGNNSYEVDLSGLNSGLYLLRLFSGKQSSAQKFFKK